MGITHPSYSWLPRFVHKRDVNKRSPSETPPNETSRLLPKSDDEDDRFRREQNGEVFNLEEDGSVVKSVFSELKILLKGSIPVILAYTLQNSLQTISVVIVGRRSPEDLATAAFSYMFAMASAFIIALGGTTALDTLCSTTFTGGQNRQDLGVLLQRAFIVLGLFYIPIVVLWIFSEPLFLALGEDEQLSRDSRNFLCCLIPGGLGYIYFEAMKKYLQAQGRFIMSSDCLSLTVLRDHATWYVCLISYFSNQCRSQLSFDLHLRNGVAWGSNSNRYLVLAIVSSFGCICPICTRRRMLGRLVCPVFSSHWNVRSSSNPWSHQCG